MKLFAKNNEFLNLVLVLLYKVREYNFFISFEALETRKVILRTLKKRLKYVLTNRIFLLLMIVFFGSTKLLAQKYIGLNVDNDLYFGSDRYYSSGIFFEYGKILKTPFDSISNFSYVSEHWILGQEINTPSLHNTEDLSKMDYTYNGWLFLGFKKEFFKSPNKGYGWGLQFGTTGAEASLAKFFQNTYHAYIINAKQLSWALSIPQAFHLNSNFSFFCGKPLNKKIKLITNNSTQLGTFRTSIKSRYGLQFGSLGGLPFFGNRLEIIQNGVSFFLGMELEYNFHDYSLSGSLFYKTSPFDFIAEKIRNKYQAGIIYIRLPWKVYLLMNNTSRFIKMQNYKRHPFLKVAISHIF